MIVLIQHAFAIFGLVYMSGALALMLTPTASLDSPMVQALGLVVGLLSAGALLFTPRPPDRPRQVYWPVLLVLAFAILSVIWSIDFEMALRRAGALALTAIFATWLTETFGPRRIVTLLFVTFTGVCLASYVAIFAFPAFGVHQATNVVAETYIGAWRGLYSHKNDLARFVALAATLALVCALLRRRHRWVYALAYLLAAVLIYGAQSSQAIVLLLLCSLTVVLLVFLRRRTAAERALALLIFVPVGIAVYALGTFLATEALGLLGKDFTLSARTEIWGVVLDGMKDHYLLGGGYGTGWGLVRDQIVQRFGRSFGHAHNGYLQLMLNIGIIGAALTFSVFIHTAAMGFIRFMRGQQTEFACFWVAYAVYFLVGNIAASFALEYNSIDLLLLVMAPNLLSRTIVQPRDWASDAQRALRPEGAQPMAR